MVLDLVQNETATRKFLDSMRRMLLTDSSRLNKLANGLLNVPAYHDFARIEAISASAALVIASQYQRAKHGLNGIDNELFAIDVHRWNPTVRRWFDVLGIFDILGISGQVPNTTGRIDGHTLFLPILSGQMANEADLERLDKALIELAEFATEARAEESDVLSAILTDMSEGIINVSQWAYPEEHPFEVQPLKRWWMTGHADRSKRELSFTLYDQGATIPKTIPAKQSDEKFVNAFKTMVAKYGSLGMKDDGHLIAVSLNPGSSGTKEAHRGFGLQRMAETIDALPDGELRIWSRYGSVLRERGGRVVTSHCPPSIGGTLVEWRFALGNDA
ncbi:hypothetical protein [uncultured Jannaschia sp.]|uniref:hypothetical protein n=1 Tax=uncultured Jannaschia sp. TaxID=293347 RepID=UPI00260B072E|nr:hypothetical protein [uncultured Jannaschia sp.]